MKNTPIIILISIVLLTSGTYVFYLYGYKEMMLVYLFSFIAVILGWILLIVSLFSLGKPKEKPAETTTPPKKSNRKGFLGFLLFFGFIFLLIAHYICLFILSSNRVEKVLATQPTKITTATVIQLKEKYSKTGSKLYAILSYHTGTEERTEEMRIQSNGLSIGEKCVIKYSVEYPDMFEMVQQY